MAQCLACARCSVTAVPFGPVQAWLWPAAGSWVSYYHPPRHLFTHHQKMGVVLRAFLLDEVIAPVCKQPIHLRDNGRLTDDNFTGVGKRGQRPCQRCRLQAAAGAPLNRAQPLGEVPWAVMPAPNRHLLFEGGCCF